MLYMQSHLDKEGVLYKEATSHDDVLDAFRMSAALGQQLTTLFFGPSATSAGGKVVDRKSP
jgi:hypothetical protein